MHSFNDRGVVWCDANHWGSNKVPVLAFIEKYKIPDKDWYEA